MVGYVETSTGKSIIEEEEDCVNSPTNTKVEALNEDYNITSVPEKVEKVPTSSDDTTT